MPAQLRVSVRVSIPPLYVRVDAIGRAFPFALGGGSPEATLTLEQDPTQAQRLVAAGDTVESVTDGAGGSRIQKTRSAPDHAWATHVLVQFPAPSGFPTPAGVHERERKLERELTRFERRGVDAAREFYRVARATSGQVRAGWSGSLVLPMWLAITRPDGDVVQQRWFDPVEVLTGPEEALTADGVFAAAAPNVRRSPEVFELSILGDARYVSLYDLRYSILLAAVALEVAWKRVILDPARPNHADITAAYRECQKAHDWFGAPTRLAIGRALKTDHRDAYTDIGALFSERNAIAHKGTPRQLSSARAERLIRAADTTIRWLHYHGGQRR